MPELPEVETVARTLRRHIVGLKIDRANLERRDIVRTKATELLQRLPERTIRAVDRRAKRILILLDPVGTLVVHLGMSGRLIAALQGDEIESHTHMRVGFAGTDVELRYRDPRRFGGVWFFDGETPLVGNRLTAVGPEPLEIQLTEFRQIMGRKRHLKALLMDQTVIAGLGNIYCDESLHAARLHPRRKGDSLNTDESKRLLQSIRSILRRAIQFNGSTFMDYRDADGAEGRFQQLLKVYQHEGEGCKNCGTTIIRLVMNGRSTFVCETCQPETALIALKRSRRAVDARQE